jgi:hypothetical protein
VQIRTVWWMWKNFPAPGGQEIVMAALWGCALSCKRWTPLIIVLVSFAKQPPWVSVEFPAFIIELRCENNQQNSVNIAEKDICYFTSRSLIQPWCLGCSGRPKSFLL